MAKLPAVKKPTIKGMSVAKLKASAEHIVNKEIGRQLSDAGREACLDIGVLLVQVLEHYEVYFNEVDKMAIDLNTIKAHFAPEVWAKFNANQAAVLEAAIRGQINGTLAAIGRHMQYLRTNKRGMDTLGPTGQAAIEARLLALQGLGEEVAGE